MCKESKHCFCHKLEVFILADNNKKLFRYFERIQTKELYCFLKQAYRIKSQLSSEEYNDLAVNKALEGLVRNYVEKDNDSEQFLSQTLTMTINVNNEKIRHQFLKTYYSYINNDCEKKPLRASLDKLIQDVEKLSYTNLRAQENFVNLLKNTKNIKVWGRQSSKSHLPRFLRKKIISDKAADENDNCSTSQIRSNTPN